MARRTPPVTLRIVKPLPELALSLLRLTVGAVFALRGAELLFVTGLGAATAGFTRAGVPLPLLLAPLLAVASLVGGVLITLNLGTRALCALLAALTLLVAVPPALHRLPGPAEAQLTLLLSVGSVALALAGGGHFPVPQWTPPSTSRAARRKG